jgi:hypothetical protein
MLNAGSAGLVDDVLDQGAIHHRQHFLRHRFGGGKKARSEAGDGEYGFANADHADAQNADEMWPH